MSVVAAFWTAEASGAVSADAVPDAAPSFSVDFQTTSGPVVTAVTVGRLRPGARVALACRDCLGQTAVEAVAGGARHVFRPKLRLNRGSRLVVTVTGRNFSRTHEFRVRGDRLQLDGRRCASTAERRRVRCGTL